MARRATRACGPHPAGAPEKRTRRAPPRARALGRSWAAVRGRNAEAVLLAAPLTGAEGAGASHNAHYATACWRVMRVMVAGR